MCMYAKNILYYIFFAYMHAYTDKIERATF